jgi:hypothetical protein
MASDPFTIRIFVPDGNPEVFPSTLLLSESSRSVPIPRSASGTPATDGTPPNAY